MSFSSKAKEELSKLNNLANKEQVKAELIGYLISNNASVIDKTIKFATESEYNINRFSKLLNNMNILDYEIDMVGKTFVITFNKNQILEFMQIDNNKLYITETQNDEECIKSLIRGIFLGSGSMNNPENKYHLEIALSTKKIASLILNVLKDMEINMKILDTKNAYSLYIKDGEEISKF